MLTQDRPLKMAFAAFMVLTMVAPPLTSLAAAVQLPFLSPETGHDSEDHLGLASPSQLQPILHRLCLPSSKSADHWPGLLKELAQLGDKHPYFELDVWSQPHVSHDGSAELSCVDFTYPSHPIALSIIDELVHTTSRDAELDWAITADAEELAARVAADRMPAANTHSPNAAGVADPIHNGYQALHNITAFMSWQVAQNAGLAELVQLGTSSENNIIEGIRLGRKDRDDDTKRRQVVVSAGAHGREWITTSVALYLISHILESPQLVERFDILVVPVLNPDGYLHTWRSDRFFRKNRQPVEGKDWWGRQCYGVDISKNFPTFFRPPSRTTSQCGPTFAGKEPLTTAESRALAEYLASPENGVVGFLDLHSYGQLLLYPWLSCSATGGSSGGSIPDEEDISELTLGAARAAKLVHNRSYRGGQGCSTMYGQDGSSVDYSYSEAGIKWSFELELRDEGSYGFLLPPEQIRPTGEETAALVDYLLNFIAKKEHL